jgi:hypothetical protein
MAYCDHCSTKGLQMLKILYGTIAALILLVLSPAAISSVAMADTWGCSAEKCLVVCQKAGGKNCSLYCDKALRDKKVSKVCK